MVLYTGVTALTLGLACLVNNRKVPARQRYINQVCLASVFMILFLLSALRIGIGNDYVSYVNTFHEIYAGYDKSYIVTEPGFNFVVKALYTMAGGEAYVLVFAVFAFVTVGLFLKALYEQSADFAMAFGLFMALGIYFRTFNTVRYYLALAMAFYAMRYVLKKQYGWFLLWVAAAALFHKSVLFVLPVYLVANLPWKKWQIALCAALGGVALLFGRSFIMELLLRIYKTYENTPYLEQTGLRETLPGLVRCLLILVLGLVCYREAVQDQEANRFYFQLNLAAVGLYTFGSFLPLVSRLGYYLITAHVLFVPGVLRCIASEKKKRLLTGLVLACAAGYFVYFLMTADQEGIRVLPYHTWLLESREWLRVSDIL